MDQFLQMLDLQLTLLVYIVFGYVAYRLKLITDENRPAFMTLLLNVLLPIMVFNSFKNITYDLLKLSFQAIIAASIIYGIIALAVPFIYRAYPNKKAKLLEYATLVNNAGFAGLPLSESMYGQAGGIIASIYLFPHRIYMWTVGINILERGDYPQQVSFRDILLKLLRNPSIVAVFLGLLRGLLEIPFPSFLDRGLAGIAGTVSPLVMIVIGSIIATVDLKGLLEEGVLYYCFIRLLAIPFITLQIMKAMSLDPTLIGVVTIMAGMPAGSTTTILAANYDLDIQFAAKITFVSILMSIITIPLLMAFI
ncbi:AEC family transporter [Aerococcus kribbianus]|uniref:AEC family transporter n=1 Tax=Aerococcus kribbianus TaxID=2999064 RepID=A0A9X3JG37_9LACT|nr:MULTISPECIES: AEC family transporter [unclassified Aerococcus]MCZ0716811.1 AEC family transporter [Aerococcus sp. YH-aer221]MCZ0725099.1 AEC family transporter [Aerococcus sp. YH-aer222]